MSLYHNVFKLWLLLTISQYVLKIENVLPVKVAGSLNTPWPMAAPGRHAWSLNPVKAGCVGLEVENGGAIICIDIRKLNDSVLIINVDDF